MVHTVLNHGAVAEVSSLLRDEYVKAYAIMAAGRVLDDKFAMPFIDGQLIPMAAFSSGAAREALSVSTVWRLRRGDIFAPLIRDGAGRLAFGEPILDAVRTYLGSALGPSARATAIFTGAGQARLMVMISHLGAMISSLNGAQLPHRFTGGRRHGAACVGTARRPPGLFHEGLNQAAVEKLPLIVIVAITITPIHPD